jgi:hypothetical protein
MQSLQVPWPPKDYYFVQVGTRQCQPRELLAVERRSVPSKVPRGCLLVYDVTSYLGMLFLAHQKTNTDNPPRVADPRLTCILMDNKSDIS